MVKEERSKPILVGLGAMLFWFDVLSVIRRCRSRGRRAQGDLPQLLGVRQEDPYLLTEKNARPGKSDRKYGATGRRPSLAWLA